jgi:hypothetical protein
MSKIDLGNEAGVFEFEEKIEVAGAYGKTCIGAQRHESDVMLSFMSPKGAGKYFILDIFLPQETAERLYTELGQVLRWNKEPIADHQKWMTKLP